MEFRGPTTLKGIEEHRLRALILRDLEVYREASSSEMRGRIGEEIPARRIRHELQNLVAEDGVGVNEPGQRPVQEALAKTPQWPRTR